MDRTISKQTDRLDSAEVTHDTVTVGILAGGVKWLEVEMEAGNNCAPPAPRTFEVHDIHGGLRPHHTAQGTGCLGTTGYTQTQG